MFKETVTLEAKGDYFEESEMQYLNYLLQLK